MRNPQAAMNAVVLCVWTARIAAAAYTFVALFSLRILWRRDPIPPHAKLMGFTETPGAAMRLSDVSAQYRAMYSVSKGVLGVMMTAVFVTYSLLFAGPLSGPPAVESQIVCWWIAAVCGAVTYPWFLVVGVRTGKKWTENGYRWPLLTALHALALGCSAAACPLWNGWQAVVFAPVIGTRDFMPPPWLLLFWAAVGPAVAITCALTRTLTHAPTDNAAAKDS